MNNDLISRSALQKRIINSCVLPIKGFGFAISCHAVDFIIESAPAVDAVEVVRCKDCVHWVEERTDLSIRTGICKMTSEIVSCVFYCAYGVKMDGGADGD